MRLALLLFLLAGCQASGPASDPRPDAPTEAPAEADDGRPDITDVPALVHRAANAARRDASVDALGWRADLAAVAEAHSRDMAARDYFAHQTPEGTSPMDRARAAGIDCRVDLGGGRSRIGVSENLYQTTAYRRIRTQTLGGLTTRTVDWYTPEGLADKTVQGWLESPGHRRNLLDGEARAHGIGVAASGDIVYVTQVLC